MATQPRETNYEVVVWDFDAAPDAVEYHSESYSAEELKESILPCYCSHRLRTSALHKATDFVRNYVEDKCAVGGAVFLNGEKLFSLGVCFQYKERYF